MSRSIGLHRLGLALTAGIPVFSDNLSKHRRRKGKSRTLDLMLYHRVRRKRISAIASRMVAPLLAQMKLPSTLRIMADCIKMYPVSVGVPNVSPNPEGSSVVEHFAVEMSVPELGVSPLNSCLVPLGQKEALLDNLHKTALNKAPAPVKVSEMQFWETVLSVGYRIFQGCRFGMCSVCHFAEDSGKCLITCAYPLLDRSNSVAMMSMARKQLGI